MKIFQIILIVFSLNFSANSALASESTVHLSLEVAVIMLNKLYFNEIYYCDNEIIKKKNISPVTCSGVMIHGKEVGETHAWIPDQEKPRRSVSFSYLRYDIPTTNIYIGDDGQSGYIYDQVGEFNLLKIENQTKLNYYCIYPYDGLSDVSEFRSAESHGCGYAEKINKDNLEQEQSFDSCPSVSVYTSDDFINKFMSDGDSNLVAKTQCSFNANNYDSTIASIGVQMKKNSLWWNELITSIWTEEDAANLPIIAFFYVVGDEKGQQSALGYQKDYCAMYGKFVPVVIFDFSKRDSDAFTGKYDEQQPCN